MALLRDLATIGTPGVLAWYLWYHQTVVEPRREQAAAATAQVIATAHERQLTAQQTMYEARIDKIVDQFLESLQEERVERRRESEMMREAFRCEKG
jgi:hypothetical protein